MFAQSNDISIYLEPYHAQRVLAWGNNTTTPVTTWKIEIAQGSEVNGTMVYEPIFEYYQAANYLKLNSQYVNNPDYYYQIQGLDASGSTIVPATGYNRACEGCGDTDTEGRAKCDGKTYAYAIDQIFTNNGNFLSMGETFDFRDANTNTTTWYYWYCDAQAYAGFSSIYFAPDYDVISINTTDIYRTPGGAPITGLIYGIQKKSKGTGGGTPDYSNYLGKSAGNLASPLSLNIFSFENTYNNIVSNSGPNWNYSASMGPFTPFECLALGGNAVVLGPNELDGPGGSGGSGGLGQKYHEFVQELGLLIQDDNNGDGEGLPKWSDFVNIVENASKAGTGNPNRLLASDILQFEIVNVMNNTRTIINPSILENAEGELLFNNITVSEGLHKVNVMFSGSNNIFPFYFEGDASSTNPNAFSNFLTVQVFPVPITNNEFTINMMAAKDLKYTYQMLDLNGTIYLEKEFELGTNEELNYYNYMEQGLAFPSNIVVNKFIFEDGSTTVIQSIKQDN